MAREETPTATPAGLVHTLLGSALSGLVSRVPCHPLDTVKARLQGVDGTRYRGIAHCLKLTYVEEGVRGLYRGFGAVAAVGTPAVCIYISSYEVFKGLMLDSGSDQKDLAFVGHFCAGMGAEAMSCLLFVPVDVVKERLQVQRKPGGPVSSLTAAASAPSLLNSSAPPLYAGSFDAFRTISRSEGILGLYKGYYATLASFGPFSAFYFVFYEQAKVYAALMEDRMTKLSLLPPAAHPKSRASNELSTVSTMAASAAAGALASVLTCPVDLAKLRLQTQRRLAPGEAIPPGHLGGLGDAFRSVYAAGGVRALFRGAGARVAFHCPNVCITFTIYEECKRLAQKLI